MNKILKVLLVGAALSFAAAVKLHAQELNQGLSFLNFKTDPSVRMSASAMAAAYNMYNDSGNDELAKAKSDLKAKKMYLKSLKASNRASVDFSSSFKKVTNAEWQMQKEAIVATFTENDVRNYIVYDKNGRWIRNMAYLFPDRIPSDLTKDVHNLYSGYHLNMALEVKEQNIHFYILYLENDSMIKHVSFYNDQVIELNEYRKIK